MVGQSGRGRGPRDRAARACTQRGYYRYAWPRRFACAETRPESRPGTLQLWQFMAIGRPLQAPPWGRGALQPESRHAPGRGGMRARMGRSCSNELRARSMLRKLCSGLS